MSTKKLDFTGVESFTRCDEGQHIAKLIKLEEKQSQAGDDMLVGTFEVIKGDSKGSKVFENFPLTQKALWKLKTYFEAIGIKAEGKIKIDLDKLIGRVCIIEVIHEEYNGSLRAKIATFLPLKKDEPTPDNDDDDDDIGDDPDEDDDIPFDPKKASLKELLSFAKENSISIPKKDREDVKKVRKAVEKHIAEQDDDDDWEDE